MREKIEGKKEEGGDDDHHDHLGKNTTNIFSC